MTDQIMCQVIGCRRTIGVPTIAPAREWICGDHWRLVGASTRRVLSLAKRRARKEGWTATIQLVADRAWTRAKAQAIERAMGITA